MSSLKPTITLTSLIKVRRTQKKATRHECKKSLRESLRERSYSNRKETIRGWSENDQYKLNRCMRLVKNKQFLKRIN